MTQINLLPWREKERHIITILFGVVMAGFVIVTLLGMIFVHIYLKMENSIAMERIQYLQSVIDQTSMDTTLLKAKQIVRQKTIDELKLIINLRKQSYEAINVLNLLINALPPTVVIQKLARVDKVYNVIGLASSDLETTAFMKSIEAVKGFKQPVLNVIKTQDTPATPGNANTNQEIQFELKIEQQD